MTYLHCSVHSKIPRISKLHPYGPALLLKHSSLSLCFWGGSQSVTPQLPPPHTHTPPHTLKEPHTFLPAALSAQLLGCYLPLHTAPSWRAFPPAVMEASLDRPLSVTHRPFQTIARREKRNEASTTQFLEKLLCLFSLLLKTASTLIITSNCAISGPEVKGGFVVFKQ